MSSSDPVFFRWKNTDFSVILYQTKVYRVPLWIGYKKTSNGGLLKIGFTDIGSNYLGWNDIGSNEKRSKTRQRVKRQRVKRQRSKWKKIFMYYFRARLGKDNFWDKTGYMGRGELYGPRGTILVLVNIKIFQINQK